MRKLMLLIAAGALWLFLAAIPAFADGGPHVAATNSGVSTLTADSCAGCHRAHTAQGQYLINQPTEEALCLGCHGTASTGATTSVMSGVQYALGGDGLRDDATTLGALRAGGFEEARIGDVGRLDTGTNFKSKVTVASAGAPVTSSHIAMTENGLTNPHTLWGNGPVDPTGNAGPSVSLECTDCHNPHGNGQYRILNTVPAPTGATAMGNLPVDMKAIDATADVIYTKTGHPFMVGDLITIANSDAALNGNWVVYAVPNGISIQIAPTSASNLGLSAASAFDIPSGTSTLGTIVRTSAPIHDSPVGTADANGIYPLKNYTVIQTKGTQSSQTGYLFYASNLSGYSSTSGDYWRRQVPWDAASGSVLDGPNGWNATVAASNQVAFNVQMTAWCSSCHSRYFAYQNPNPGDWDGTSTFYPRIIDSVSGTTIVISTTNPAPGGGNALTSSGFSLGDKVTVTGTDNDVTNGYVVFASGMNIRVSATFAGSPLTFTSGAGGHVARVAPAVASNYFFPDQNSAGQQDSIFKYQHSTRDNRVCSTCHVAHGSNRVMTGPYTYSYTQPDGTQPSKYTVPDQSDGVGTVDTADSRLLKVDNRGTCEACHDPTSTWASTFSTGTYQGAPAGISGGTWGTNASGQPINTGGTPVVP